MRHLIRQALRGASSVAVIGLLLTSPVGAQVTMTDLGTIAGDFSLAIAVNQSGQVAGASTIDASNARLHATLWSDGAIVDLGGLCSSSCPPNLDYSYAFDINEAGQIVGGAYRPDGMARGVVWDNGTVTALAALPGDFRSWAYGINNLGQIVGESSGYTGSRAVLWPSAAGEPIDLGIVGGAGYGWANAYGINDAGQVVGQYLTTTGAYKGFVWRNGLLTDLTGGAPPCGSSPPRTTATAINESGAVSGFTDFNCATHAAIWRDGVVQDLGALTGPASVSLAWYGSINDAGEVSGASHDGVCGYHAVLWTQGTIVPLGAYPLDTGCPYSAAYGLNDRGQVAGYSYTSIGAFRAVLWTIVPPDTTPPDIALRAVAERIWPDDDDGRWIQAAFAGRIVDEGSGVERALFTVEDEYGRVRPSGQVTLATDGAFTIVVWLETMRDKRDQDGRTYTLTVTAMDRAGNGASASAATVISPPREKRRPRHD